jgi:vacuolar-type H+-ATPase subunit H
LDVESSEFFNFIREASSREKKKVYKVVLRDAVEAQDRIIKNAELKISSERPKIELSDTGAHP